MPAATATVVARPWPAAGADVLGAPGRLWACLGLSAVVLLASLALGVGSRVYREHYTPLWLPVVAPQPPLQVFYDITPIEVTVTRGWMKFSFVVPRYEFLGNRAVWQEMHFGDWDLLDPASRQKGLTRLLAVFGELVADPPRWARMAAADWDDVPQPIRAMAIVGMIEHWVRYYGVGAAYDLDPTLVLRTAKAIAMSESWFDHRAIFINVDGTSDVGVGGASAFARETLRRLHERGLADFTLRDDEYYNPWLAARWLAFWLQLSLDEASGDLSLATRAYNVGIGRATRGGGEPYLAGVERRRHRYFEGPSDSPTWSALSQYRRDQLWLPRIVVRATLRVHAPVTPCVDEGCGLPVAPPMVPPGGIDPVPFLPMLQPTVLANPPTVASLEPIRMPTAEAR